MRIDALLAPIRTFYLTDRDVLNIMGEKENLVFIHRDGVLHIERDERLMRVDMSIIERYMRKRFKAGGPISFEILGVTNEILSVTIDF